MILVVAVSAVAYGAQVASDDFLSGSLFHHIWTSTQAWGELGVNTCTHAPGQKANPLRIGDKTYEKGLGHHANGEIVVALDGQFLAFEAEVGVQKQAQNIGSVVFQVFVDDEKRFDSGVMRESDPARPIRIPVAGAQDLRLVVTDAGDGITCDCANWANARLVRDPAATSGPAAVRKTLDAAPFGRVVTWDPARTEGSRASRIEEFRTEDLFTESDVLPTPEGTYVVPTALDGRGCIGLQWMERRLLRELGLQFVGASHILPTDGVQVQCWVGESIWQGSFKPVKGTIETEGDRWSFRFDLRENVWLRAGVWKVRWVFPPATSFIHLRALSAMTRSLLQQAELMIELAEPLAGAQGEIEVYNGQMLGADGAPLFRQTWDLSKPLQLNVRYSRPRFWKPDRTVLRFRLPAGAFGVAVDDVLSEGGVYVRDLGVFVAHGPAAKAGLAEYRKTIQGRKTVLQRVREMPDQTFEQAMAKVHRPIQNNGPVMLSLACDNRKFVVHRDGVIDFPAGADLTSGPAADPFKLPFRLRPRLGSGKNEGLTRHMYGGWLPVPVIAVREDGLEYTQRTYVAPFAKEEGSLPTNPWLGNKPVCVVEFTIKNTTPNERAATMALSFLSDSKTSQPAVVEAVAGGAIVKEQDRLVAFVDASGVRPLELEVKAGSVALNGPLPPGGTARCIVSIPAWVARVQEHGTLSGADALLKNTETYWKGILEAAMQVSLPDPMLENLIRASQVHCLIAARNEDHGRRVAPWIASMAYGPLESEANSIILGMDQMGHHEFARRSLEYFIKRYNPAGYLTTGYTIVGTGFHLWALANHCDLTGDSDWLRRVAPEVGRVCRWIAQQREKTKRVNARLEKVPEYGLTPPGVVADWNVFAYRVFALGHYCAGLSNAARVLAEIGYPDADSLRQGAEEFRREIQRAYRWAQANSPVLALADGTWVPADPSMINCLDRVNTIYPGEDGNRSWASDVEIGAHHLVAMGVLDPLGREATWMLDRLEDVEFLGTGMGEYPAAENQKDWFSLGGFAKIQPYYGRTAIVHALRDDVKPFVRAYFNAIATLFNTEVMSFWEHFHNMGAWNKTHETGWFLDQTRTMLLMERGDALWLAPFITSHWLKDGRTVAVRNAPTRFGPVSYRITSSVRNGVVEAAIESPARQTPKAVVIRLRHPDGRPMRAVTVNGVEHKDFDALREWVKIDDPTDRVAVRAVY